MSIRDRRMTYRACTWNCKINFEMLVMVPGKTGHTVARFYAQPANQCRRKFFTSPIQVSIGVTMPLTVGHQRNDLLSREYPVTIFNNGMSGQGEIHHLSIQHNELF